MMETSVTTSTPTRYQGRLRPRKEGYEALLGRLSHQSVVKHYDAYADIAWDSSDFAIDPEDPRWELPEDDTLSVTAWYRSQPEPVRARIGLHATACKMRVGVEFENVLKRGLLEFAATLPSDAPELRYAYHEVIEEAQHSLMFSEFVRRTGLQVPGLSARMQWYARRVVSFGRRFPELFFVFVLGGEEPIDHAQRRALASSRNIHPVLRRIVQIHVTEEARHLCFAHEYLRRAVPALKPTRKLALQMRAPFILGMMTPMMMQAPEFLIRTYGIPDEAVRDAYTDNAIHRCRVHESLESVRQLCIELGIVGNGWTRLLWRHLGLWPDAQQGG
jgi:hypothetical protein